jgi:6-phosphogluconolactonase
MTDPRLIACPDADSLARAAAEWLLGVAAGTTGNVAVALSGGSTPRRLYALLATPPIMDAFPWGRTHWFLGDERFVPHDDPLSNFRMAREAFLSHAPVPAENIHPVTTEGLDVAEAARRYQAELAAYYGSETLDPARPLLDVCLLGLGTDGHTASLFPGSSALAERDKWVVAVTGAKAEDRVTLTFPAIASSRRVAFLVEGEAKRDMLKRLLAGDESIPAGRVRPVGELLVFADAAASA